MALVKYLPIFKMAAIVNFLAKSNLEAPRICVLCSLLEVHMYFNEYNKVKSSTVRAGYDVGVTNMIKVYPLKDETP